MKISNFKNTLFAAALILFAAGWTSCNNAQNQEDTDNDVDTLLTTNAGSMENTKTAEATIQATYSDTAASGSALFTENNGKITLNLNLDIPSKANQNVAVHIHETGDCGDSGHAAHGHWNPTNKQHGKWGEGEFHLGDIGNVQLDGLGKGTLTMETDLWNIGGDSTGNILNRAIIVHGGTDDFKTQPTGGAGNRIGCGVIQQK